MLNSETLKWTDFILIDEAGFTLTKAGTFYAATYGASKLPVTLLVSPTDSLTDTSQHKTDAFSLRPVSKFIEDNIPAEFMSASAPAGKGMYKKNVEVFFRNKGHSTHTSSSCQVIKISKFILKDNILAEFMSSAPAGKGTKKMGYLIFYYLAAGE